MDYASPDQPRIAGRVNGNFGDSFTRGKKFTGMAKTTGVTNGQWIARPPGDRYHRPDHPLALEEGWNA